MLNSYRALDLTDEQGHLCGKVLADLGAEVIKIEPPGGDASRSIGPYYHDTPHPEGSLRWLAYNTGKKSITLNLENPKGQEILIDLVRKADFLIESFPPGYLESHNLGYTKLRELSPTLIMASITPFGQAGPYKDYKTSDLVAMAMGGFLYITGDPDRPPVRISVEQAFVQASAHATIGLLLAFLHRHRTREGQHVDVSIQESVVRTLHTQLPFWEYARTIIHRLGIRRLRAGTQSREIWPCRDGFVSWLLFGGVVGAPQMRRLVRWMEEEGMAEELREEVKEWESKDLAKVSHSEVERWEEIIGKFFLAHTKDELYKQALARELPIAPVNTPADAIKDEHLKTRGFWTTLEHPEMGALITYPGYLYYSTEESPKPERRAPLLGEHNEEIYCRELGFSQKALELLRKEGVV